MLQVIYSISLTVLNTSQVSFTTGNSVHRFSLKPVIALSSFNHQAMDPPARILPKIADARTTRIINAIVGWVWQVGRNGTLP